ncbi:MAG: ubiquinone/menaquinone biosynthesis methyltransferase [Gemmatimonadales bacterium]|nr:ubiquinone/menaquinone biosynthesis methyltransferase [Gemmatimonadales bacterium]
MMTLDHDLPVQGGAAKRAYVRGMFDAIAPTYDRLNRILSLNLDRAWRRRGLALLGWERAPEGTYLDLCAGTCDFAALLEARPGFRGRIIGADFVPRMLQLGRGKATRLSAVGADALALPFPDAAFDGLTVGWGARNLADLDAGLREMARVLRPGARLVILDMSIPPAQPMRGLFLFYFERILPRLGGWLSRHRDAYAWLPASTRAFPEPPALAERLRAAGFGEVRFERLLFGVTALHVGTRGAA